MSTNFFYKELGYEHLIECSDISDSYPEYQELEKIGADKVVHPERDMGIRIAHNLVSKNILEFIELSDEFTLAEIRVTNPRFFNKTLIDLNFRQKFGLTIVAIRRGNGKVVVSPDASEVIKEFDNLLVIGASEDVDMLDDKINK